MALDLHRHPRKNKYLESAIAHLTYAKESFTSYIDIKNNNVVSAAAELLGIDISALNPYDFIDLIEEGYEELTLSELLVYLTRLKLRLKNIDDIVDGFSLALNNQPTKDLSHRSLLNDANNEFERFQAQHLNFIRHIESAYLFLVLQSSLDANEDHGAKAQESIARYLEESIGELSVTKDKISDEIENRSLVFDLKFEDFKTSFQEQEDRIHGIAQGLIEQLDKNFSSQQSTNLEAVTKQTRVSVNEIQVTAQNATNRFHDLVDSQIGEIKSRINKEVSQFETYKIEIEGILGDISNAHQSNANRIQADKEQEVADKLRKWGVIGLISVILFSLHLFNSYLGFFGETNVTDSQLTAQWFLVRFLTITLLTGPFIYLLKESASHRSKENLYRQRGTQLSSIGAYLSELDIQERTLLKKELARNFFSFHDGKVDTQNVPDFLRDMKQLVGIAKSINGSQKTVGERLRRK